jgi:hypothetical protein
MQIMFYPASAAQLAAEGVQFDPSQVLTLAIGVVLPLLAGLLTRSNASAGVRAVVLLVLAAITSFLTMLLDSITTHTPFDVGAALLAVLGAFLVGVGSHFGFWAPTGASDAVKRTGGFIGGSSSSQADRTGSF